MSFNKIICTSLLLTIFCILEFSLAVSAEKSKKTILIGLLTDQTSITISGTDAFNIIDPTAKTERAFAGKKNYKVYPSKEGIIINQKSFGKNILVAVKQNGLVKINGRRYRGKVIITLTQKGTLDCINKINIDDYIRGILKREISPGWPQEALTAQAIISRTYALKNLHRHKDKGFNLCSSVHCQVYGGREAEDIRIDNAVKETSGMVLTFKGKLAQAVFSSTCGGSTEKAEHVWNLTSTPSYLKGKRCSYCTKSPRYHWNEFISFTHIENVFKSHDVKKPIKKISINRRYASGRAKSISIKHGNGTTHFQPNNFRIIIGPSKLRSTRITSIKKLKNGFLIKGRGAGHGVGLCQWGMKRQAEKGFSYKKILTFYYPGTKIKHRD